jgi:hypothetical protein
MIGMKLEEILETKPSAKEVQKIPTLPPFPTAGEDHIYAPCLIWTKDTQKWIIVNDLRKLCYRCHNQRDLKTQRYCRECRLKYRHDWGQLHQDKLRGYRRKWKLENYGKVLENKAKYKKRKRLLNREGKIFNIYGGGEKTPLYYIK